MSSRLPAAFTRMVTDCTHNRHRYRPTWTLGYVICLDCGKRAACPVCVPQWPDPPSAFWLCPRHRPKEEAR